MARANRCKKLPTLWPEKERTKTKVSREVLLNDRALQALEKARPLTAARSDYVSRRKVRMINQSCTSDPKRGLSAIG